MQWFKDPLCVHDFFIYVHICYGCDFVFFPILPRRVASSPGVHPAHLIPRWDADEGVRARPHPRGPRGGGTVQYSEQCNNWRWMFLANPRVSFDGAFHHVSPHITSTGMLNWFRFWHVIASPMRRLTSSTDTWNAATAEILATALYWMRHWDPAQYCHHDDHDFGYQYSYWYSTVLSIMMPRHQIIFVVRHYLSSSRQVTQIQWLRVQYTVTVQYELCEQHCHWMYGTLLATADPSLSGQKIWGSCWWLFWVLLKDLLWTSWRSHGRCSRWTSTANRNQTQDPTADPNDSRRLEPTWSLLYHRMEWGPFCSRVLHCPLMFMASDLCFSCQWLVVVVELRAPAQYSISLPNFKSQQLADSHDEDYIYSYKPHGGTTSY